MGPGIAYICLLKSVSVNVVYIFKTIYVDICETNVHNRIPLNDTEGMEL